jgi:hypothetical protein
MSKTSRDDLPYFQRSQLRLNIDAPEIMGLAIDAHRLHVHFAGQYICV